MAVIAGFIIATAVTAEKSNVPMRKARFRGPFLLAPIASRHFPDGRSTANLA
jgi:hypothetical protein